MATLKQVAERAGVSTSTVSHVINNTRVVSEDVRLRVLAIIDEMRYIPSAVARSLKNDKTHTIGMMVPNNSNPYFAELIQGIEDAAFKVARPAGANFVYAETGEDVAPLYEALLREGVIVRPLAGFGAPQAIRVTVGTPEENEVFADALARARAAVAS